MTKPCAPEKTEKSVGTGQSPKPIGFAPEAAVKDRTLSCVGIASESQSFPDLPSPSQSDTQGGDGASLFTRVREDEIPSERWNSQKGEFDNPEAKRSSGRDSAWDEVKRALAQMRKNRG
jgi:hypothetical protein